MNPKRYTKAMPVKNTNDEMIEVGAMEFADSRIPLMEKKRGVEFVPFGDRNDYPTYLLWLYNKSAKHNAIINGKCVYIMGNGLMTESEPGKVFLQKANEKQSWDQLMKLACLDIENFGGVYLQVIPKLAGGFNVYHMSYDRIRANEDNTCFYYRKKWNNTWEQPEAEYPAFNPSNNKTSIFYFKEYRCGKNPYALPSWVAACNWVESDIEVSRHTLTNAKTGFSASKFINFYNGEPDEDKKRKITARLENAATGAEGKKVLIGFNNDPSKRPTIDDLGASDLTKEDFGAVDNLITNNIFSGHNITHPLLFGIQQEGKLGNSSELKTAYEIFKNTYVTHKQKQVEEIVGYFSGVAGVDAEYKLKDVEPVGMDFDAATILQVAPKDWITDKLGIDKKYFEITQSQGAKNVINALNSLSPLVANKVLESMSEDEIRSLVNLTPKSSVLDINGMPVVNPSTDQKLSNAALVNISGRQQQNLLRIVRLFSQGKLTKGQASIQLSAYGFTDEQINQYLGVDADPMTADEQFNDDSDEFIADMFAEYGDDRESFSILKSEIYAGDDDDFKMSFAAVSEFTERESKIMELLKKQPDLSNVQIAEALKYDTNVVDDIIENLVKRDVIAAAVQGGINIRKVTERIPAQTLPDIKVMYTYELRPDVPPPAIIPTTRAFCKKMLSLSKSRMFSRQDIQKLSERLGYSVFTRAGGWWGNSYKCRHTWMKHVVIKKK
jgi:hypothetical protein